MEHKSEKKNDLNVDILRLKAGKPRCRSQEFFHPVEVEKRGRVHRPRRRNRCRGRQRRSEMHQMGSSCIPSPASQWSRPVHSLTFSRDHIVEIRGQQKIRSSFLILSDLREPFFCSAQEDQTAERQPSGASTLGCGFHLPLSGSIVPP